MVWALPNDSYKLMALQSLTPIPQAIQDHSCIMQFGQLELTCLIHLNNGADLNEYCQRVMVLLGHEKRVACGHYLLPGIHFRSNSRGYRLY